MKREGEWDQTKKKNLENPGNFHNPENKNMLFLKI